MRGILLDIKDITDSREVMESKEPPHICWFIYILLFILITAIILSYFFEIDEYAKVNGEIKTLQIPSSIISPANSKVSRIFIEEGKSVKKGDLLFSLDVDYAKEQYEIYKKKQDSYSKDLEKTELLKTSIEQNKNMFKNSKTDSKYYYRFEQYKNGILITEEESDKSQKKSDLSTEENRNNLESNSKSIAEKEDLITEYERLIDCIENNMEYSGASDLLYAQYLEYSSSYQKLLLQCEQLKTSYENLSRKYDDQKRNTYVSPLDVQTAQEEMETASSEMYSYKEEFLSDIKSKIFLLQNQLVLEPENIEIKDTLTEYSRLVAVVEQDNDLSSINYEIQNSFEQYKKVYSGLSEKYKQKFQDYQELCSKYKSQDSADLVSEDQLTEAENLYNSAHADLEETKEAFISKLQQSIYTLHQDLQTLKKSKKSLEVSIKGADDLSKYKELSKEKLKTEALLTVNQEIDDLKERVSSVDTQLTELKNTIDNSEIKAACDGTVTFLNELNEGDIIQAGNRLCNIVPSSGELKANIYIPENDVSKIKIGQKTEYIFDAMPYNEYGKITGKITAISADAIADENTGKKYYVAQADLSALVLENNKGDVREVKNGMLLEAKIVSGSKKVIVWLFEKINFME